MEKRTANVESGPVNVFEYEDPREFLAATFSEKQQRNPKFSLRAWSRQLGFSHPSYLSAVLRGSRRLKIPLAKRISENLKLNEIEKRHFSLLVIRKNAKSDTELTVFGEALKRSPSRRTELELGLDRFRLIADWYHLTILEMMRLSDFQPDFKYIFKRLGRSIPETLVKSAVARLIRVGLLEKETSGRWVRTGLDPKVGDKGSSEAIRSHHLQILEKTRRVLQEHDTEERDFRGSTFVLADQNRVRAIECIKRFHQEMRDLSGPGPGDEVFRFNTQLFRLTERIEP